MRATQRFKRDNEDNVDANIKAQFASQAAARWLGLRLQFIGVAMVSGVSFIAIIQHQYDVADPGRYKFVNAPLVSQQTTILMNGG